jgi:hypothetical protein
MQVYLYPEEVETWFSFVQADPALTEALASARKGVPSNTKIKMGPKALRMAKV